MPKLYSSKQIQFVLIVLGFQKISQKGSHQKFRSGKKTVILVANRKLIPIGTFKAILKQAGITQSEFEKLSK
jgi:predicted RNA binding protein YcfA (HicA-like mRNA interferase family)